ncbi:MAG TPA: CBO0543 family protein [Symbiobacteriaceae bacterium]|nr:CBO0543 family protein [Symbiobacteriaceae bacterium]
MFYLPMALATWLCVDCVIDRRQLPHLLVYGLFGAVLATVQDRLVLIYHLWEYADIGPVDSHAEIALLISLSAAPLFAMRFAQGLSPGDGFPWRRIAKFTLVAMLPEVVGLITGHIRYHNWWNVGWSVLAYLPIWAGIWGLYIWLTGPVFQHAQLTTQGD